MQDSERGSAADWERANVEGSNVSAKRRSRRRWSAEEKARIRAREFLAWEAGGGCRTALRAVAQAVVDVAQPRTPRQARGAVCSTHWADDNI